MRCHLTAGSPISKRILLTKKIKILFNICFQNPWPYYSFGPFCFHFSVHKRKRSDGYKVRAAVSQRWILLRRGKKKGSQKAKTTEKEMTRVYEMWFICWFWWQETQNKWRMWGGVHVLVYVHARRLLLCQMFIWRELFSFSLLSEWSAVNAGPAPPPLNRWSRLMTKSVYCVLQEAMRIYIPRGRARERERTSGLWWVTLFTQRAGKEKTK